MPNEPGDPSNGAILRTIKTDFRLGLGTALMLVCSILGGAWYIGAYQNSEHVRLWQAIETERKRLSNTESDTAVYGARADTVIEKLEIIQQQAISNGRSSAVLMGQVDSIADRLDKMERRIERVEDKVWGGAE